MDVDGKVAVITGSSAGVGRGTAELLASLGAKVVINYAHSKDDAEETVQAITDAGGTAHAVQADVGDDEQCRSLIASAVKTYGGLHILVNNAGILRDRTIFNMEEEDWDAVMAVHLKGHYCCTRPFAQYIRETNRPGCRIINFSSVSGLYGNFGQTNYGAAKAGIAGFSRVLALELAKYGATVNTISPGASTRMTISLREARGVHIDVNAPDQSPKQIAEVVTWLASGASQDINAQIIDVMQGWVGIMQQPAVIESYTTDGMWTLDDLDKAMPALMKAKREHDDYVKKKGAPKPLA